jgi:hypothetical protein
MARRRCDGLERVCHHVMPCVWLVCFFTQDESADLAVTNTTTSLIQYRVAMHPSLAALLAVASTIFTAASSVDAFQWDRTG